ncbi:Tensin-3, partial [Camelus dromedarius]
MSKQANPSRRKVGDEPPSGRFQKLSVGQYDNETGGPPAFSKSECGWGKPTSAEQAPSLVPFLSPASAKETAIPAYPQDLDGVDGRVLSPTCSGSETLPPTPAFPMSPEMPYVTTPRYPSFSPPGPPMGGSSLYRGAQVKTPLSSALGVLSCRSTAMCLGRTAAAWTARAALAMGWRGA